MNNFDNLLITLFIIFFCYILFYRIYNLCFGSKIVEGIDGDNSASATATTGTKTGPKVVTKESVKKEDKKKKKGPSSKDAEKQANAANQQMLVNNKNRQEANQPTPPSNKLLEAKFS